VAGVKKNAKYGRQLKAEMPIQLIK